MTPLDELLLAAGCVVGLCCGAIPAIVGALKSRLGLGLMGFVACSFAGCAFGLLGGLPIAAIFTYLAAQPPVDKH